MLEPFEKIILKGDELLADVEACAPANGELALWWLGQHSFIVKVHQTVIYIDPFLTNLDGRQVPSLLIPDAIRNVDIICGTHDHADHIDRPVWPALAAASPHAKFVVPELLRERLSRELPMPVERLVGLDEGWSVEIAGVTIKAVAASHEFLDRDPVSGLHPYLGFIFEAGGWRWYHAGDTVWYEGLQTKLRTFGRFDLMLLPINGRDANRLRMNIIGNMTYQEAADLAGPLNPVMVIPTHYEMFEINMGNPDGFRDYMEVKYPLVKTHRCRHGERFVLRRGATC